VVEVSSELSVEVAGLIPHSGEMCLLRRIHAFDDTTIECRADSHRDTSNPLRNATGLPISAGIEYAAQAMAVHGALGAKDSGRPRSGYLAVLSRVEWFRETLDDLPGELAVVAHRLASSESGSNYRFQVFHEGQSLLEGQAVVALRD
jgi:predicted hotdog family 3-hydroxylacyl-ACP dehydratase